MNKDLEGNMIPTPEQARLDSEASVVERAALLEAARKRMMSKHEELKSAERSLNDAQDAFMQKRDELQAARAEVDALVYGP